MRRRKKKKKRIMSCRLARRARLIRSKMMKNDHIMRVY